MTLLEEIWTEKKRWLKFAKESILVAMLLAQEVLWLQEADLQSEVVLHWEKSLSMKSEVDLHTHIMFLIPHQWCTIQ